MQKIILASNSPRRKELLAMLNIPFEIKSKNVSEAHTAEIESETLPLLLAQRKARAFLNEITDEIVIGADTIVLLENEVFEKPKSSDEAIAMLKKLSGKTHEVITGVCILSKEKEVSFSEKTSVTFEPLNENEIVYYVEQFKPFDKAGSYACQEWIGAVGISKFEGSYFNVVGLPVHKVYQTLIKDFKLKTN